MKKLFCITLLTASCMLLLTDCTYDSKAGSKVKLPPALPPLDVALIYSYDDVYNYAFDNEERDIDSTKQAAKKLFLLAIDFYKNKKNIRDAIPAFKKSVVLFPDAKTYNELGNALMEQGNYAESIQAYEMAVKMGYHPLSETYFYMACAEAQGENSNTYTYLREAFNNGFNDSLRFVNEYRLGSIRNSPFYREMLLTKFNKSLNEKELKFELFLSGFMTLENPYSINEETAGTYNEDQYISYDFSDYVEEMENASFGRDVSNEFIYAGIVKQTDKYTALLYHSVEMMGDVFPPVYTMIVTYDKEGTQISNMVFACRCSSEKIKTGTIDGSKLKLTEQKVIWEKDITSVPFEENKISSYEILESKEYLIDEEGKINPVTGS